MVMMDKNEVIQMQENLPEEHEVRQMGLAENVTDGNKDLRQLYVDIISIWKQKWGAQDDPDLFVHAVESMNHYHERRAAINREKNFLHKGCFVFLVSIFGICGFALSCILYFVKEVPVAECWAILSMLGACVSIALLAYAKWINIKKYQETWSRHRKVEQLMIAEMSKYVLEISPYNNDKRKNEFMKNTIAIWNENTILFCNNLENKETDISEALPSAGHASIKK